MRSVDIGASEATDEGAHTLATQVSLWRVAKKNFRCRSVHRKFTDRQQVFHSPSICFDRLTDSNQSTTLETS